MVGHDQWRRLPEQLVPRLECTGIQSFDLRDEPVSHVPPDDVGDILERAQEDDAKDLGSQACQGVKEGHEERVERVREFVFMVRHELHHAQAIPYFLFNLEVHQDRADEADAEDRDAHRKHDIEVLVRTHHDDGNSEQSQLEACHEECI